MSGDQSRYERVKHGRRLAHAFVLDAISTLGDAGDKTSIEDLEDMLGHDGPDLDGCVVALGENGLVTQHWVDRLTELNDIFGDLDEELAELKEYLTAQQT